VQLLLEANCPQALLEKDELGATPVRVCGGGRDSASKHILSVRHEADRNGVLLLRVAAEGASLDVIRLLGERRPDSLTAKTKYGCCPADYAWCGVDGAKELFSEWEAAAASCTFTTLPLGHGGEEDEGSSAAQGSNEEDDDIGTAPAAEDAVSDGNIGDSATQVVNEDHDAHGTDDATCDEGAGNSGSGNNEEPPPPHRSRPRRQAARPRPLCCAVAGTVPPLLEDQCFLIAAPCSQGSIFPDAAPSSQATLSSSRFQDAVPSSSLLPFPYPAPSSSLLPYPRSGAELFPTPFPRSGADLTRCIIPDARSGAKLGLCVGRSGSIEEAPKPTPTWDHYGGATSGVHVRCGRGRWIGSDRIVLTPPSTFWSSLLRLVMRRPQVLPKWAAAGRLCARARFHPGVAGLMRGWERGVVVVVAATVPCQRRSPSLVRHNQGHDQFQSAHIAGPAVRGHSL
jgi:hypothetical protein